MIPNFVDANDKPIGVGDPIDSGDGPSGTIVGFWDCDEDGWAILVEWPEWPEDPEMFYCSAPPYWREGDPWRCDDIKVPSS